MLSRNSQYSIAILALAAVATTGLTGCHEVRKPHPTAAFLDGGNDKVKVSAKQAADVQIALGRSSEQQNDFEGAIVSYKQAIAKDPKRADAYNRLAVLHDRQGKFTESADYYQKALDLKPGNAELFADKGYSLYLQRRWAEAEMNLRQAVVLKPNLARAHNNLGLVLANGGRIDESLVEFQKSGLSESDAHVNVAFVLATGNQQAEAKTHYETALALNPSSEPARLGLNDLNKAVVSVTNANNARALASRPAPTALDPSVATASQVAPVQALPRMVRPTPSSPPPAAAAPLPASAIEPELPPLPMGVPTTQKARVQPAYSAAFGQPALATAAPARRPLAVGDTAVRVTSGTSTMTNP